MKKIEKTNELRVKDTEKLQEYLGNKEALHLNEKKLRLDFMSWLDFEKNILTLNTAKKLLML